jgi:DNA polymerase III subunit gamma/tau
MTYIVTARKWRPVVFDDIVGQSHIATTLRNAITSDRLSHAYIFSGPRGVGKTTTARILAKTVNCLHPKNNNPDNTCELCTEINDGRSVNVFEIDGASNRGVEEIRNLRESVRYGPAKGKYKIYIIDEVHMLTKEAFNALLKTLEEPPSYVIFIFATTEIHKVPLTILSRCQRFDFRRITIEEISERLRFIAREEKITIDDEALFLIARRGDGSMRDAQSIFDQVVSYCGERVDAKQILTMLNIVDEETYFRITDLIKAKDVKGGLLLVDEVISRGYDVREFLNGLMEHLRNILVARSTKNATLIESSDHYRKRYSEMAERFTESDILRLIKIASDTETAIRWSQQPRLKLEIGLVQMIKLDSSVEIATLLKQLEDFRSSGDRPMVKSSPSLSDSQPPLSTSAPVKGSVKATPPTLRAEQIVVPAPPVAEPPPTYQRQSLASPMTNNDILSKWSVVVEETRKKRIALGTMLGETSPVGVHNGTLRIGCPDDFHRDTLTLKRNNQFLQDLAEQVYGAKLHLEAIISHSTTAQEQNPKSTDVTTPPKEQDGNQHPVVEALIREFGAKPINR